MLRNILFALLLLSTGLASCKRDDKGPENAFTIDGIKDVSFDSAGIHVLNLSVAKVSGMAERVVLSVSGLPSGAMARISPSAGTPPFNATITFSQSGPTTPGIYPIHIKGSGTTYFKTYDLSLVVPGFNGFIFDDRRFTKSSMSHNTQTSGSGSFSSITIDSEDDSGATVSAYIGGAWPTQEGNHTYKIGGSGSDGMDVSVTLTGGDTYNSSSTGEGNKTATIIVSGGKFTLMMSNIQVSKGSDTKLLTVMANE